MKEGKVWKYGNNINTDIISPPESLEYDIKEAARFAMMNVDPNFAKQFKDGDIFVAEHNLGSGSSRETAPLVLKALGVHIIIAKDYARIFYRNCINVGLIPIECAETSNISNEDILDIDVEKGVIHNMTKNEYYSCSPMPKHILKIAQIGGLIPYIEKYRLSKADV